MRKWTGELGIKSLPDEIEAILRKRCKNTLERLGLPDSDVQEIVEKLIDEVSFSYAGNEHKLAVDGAGRPPDGPANLLSVNVADVLGQHGIHGNWLGLGDNKEDGRIGPVAELEAIAQTTLREACGKLGGVLPRPARISKSRKLLGKIHRN
jgi:hypothetical protein